MDSKRRNKLEGKDEMYDLYESELSANLIINSMRDINRNLETVVDNTGRICTQLDGIMANQQLLYREIAAGNTSARTISDALLNQRIVLESNGQKLSSVNQYNAEMIATQQILSENSNITKDLAEIKQRIIRQNWE